MPVKILLIGAPLSNNLGGPSLLVTTKTVLSQCFDEAEFAFVSHNKEDVSLSEAYDIDICITPISFSRLLIPFLVKAFLKVNTGQNDIRKILALFNEADIIVDIWGICFSDSIRRRSLRSVILQGVHLFYGKIFKKIVIKYTSDLGPFTSRSNKFFSKIYLNYFTDLIFARGETTYKRLKILGIKTPIYVFPDTAFLLPPQNSNFVDSINQKERGKYIIGFSVSHMAARHFKDAKMYYHIMSRFADFVIKKTGAVIIFIPNEFSEIEARDDLYATNLVTANMKYKNNIYIVDKKYRAQKIKGIIQHCNVVIAARYHTIIASLSLGVPVFAIGWHFKYFDVLNLFDQENYLFEIHSLDIKKLEKKFLVFWRSRDDLTKDILNKIPIIKQLVYEGGEVVKSFFENEKK